LIGIPKAEVVIFVGGINHEPLEISSSFLWFLVSFLSIPAGAGLHPGTQTFFSFLSESKEV